MPNNFISVLQQVLTSLSACDRLVLRKSELLDVQNASIASPIGDLAQLLAQSRNDLSNQQVSLSQLGGLVKNLAARGAIVRLNHVGFCYKVDSQSNEKSRILQLLTNSKYHLYVEPSTDDGLWLFLGNAERWQDMLIELLPVERTDDPASRRWLPQVQIDIDTTFSELQIARTIKATFGNSITPFSIAIDGVVYIVRLRLGCIDGININLDLATKHRDVELHRYHILQRVTA